MLFLLTTLLLLIHQTNIKHAIKPSDLLNTVLLTRTKMLVNSLLMSNFNERATQNGIRTTAPPGENCPPVRTGVWVKVKVSFRVGGQPGNCSRRKQFPRLGLRFGLGLVLGLGDNFPHEQLSQNHLEHKLHIFEIVLLNTEKKDCKSRENLCTKSFTYTKLPS